MKTATVREAQHHLSKLLNEVEKGEEIVLTRRGKEVGKLVPVMDPKAPREKEIDWAAWAVKQREFLAKMPHVGENVVLEERASYRW